MSIPGHYAVMATREVVVALAALHTRAGISDGKGAAGDLPCCAAGNDGAGSFIPWNYLVLAKAFCRASWIGHAESTLARAFHTDHRAAGFFPPADAILLVLRRTRGCPGIGNGEGSIGWAVPAGYRAGGFIPARHPQIPGPVFRDDDQVTQVAILNCQLVQAAPVAARFNQGKAHPGLPLQGGYPMHWTASLDITGQRHAPQHVADAAQVALVRL